MGGTGFQFSIFVCEFRLIGAPTWWTVHCAMGRNAVKSGRIVKTTRVRTFKTTKKRLRKVLKAAGSDRDASRRQKSSGRYNSSKRPFPDTVSRGGESPGMEEWAGLGVPLPLLRGLSDLGFHQPTEIQRAVLPIATQQESCDIVAAAETVNPSNCGLL